MGWRPTWQEPPMVSYKLAKLLPIVFFAVSVAQQCVQFPETRNEGFHVHFSCNATGSNITSIAFSAYGVASGDCTGGSPDDNTFAVNNTCNAATSVGVVEKACLGQPSCSFVANNDFFGDPCLHVAKSYKGAVKCSSPTPPPPTPPPPNPGCPGPLGDKFCKSIDPHSYCKHYQAHAPGRVCQGIDKPCQCGPAPPPKSPPKPPTPPAPTPSKPLYRCYRSSYNDHMVSNEHGCETPGWHLEKSLGCSLSGGNGTVGLFRCLNHGTGEHSVRLAGQPCIPGGVTEFQLGYLYNHEPTTGDGMTLYQCDMGRSGPGHMVSADSNCEGYKLVQVLGWSSRSCDIRHATMM